MKLLPPVSEYVSVTVFTANVKLFVANETLPIERLPVTVAFSVVSKPLPTIRKKTDVNTGNKVRIKINKTANQSRAVRQQDLAGLKNISVALFGLGNQRASPVDLVSSPCGL